MKAEEYRTTGLRMTSLARPAVGKVPEEMLAFAVVRALKILSETNA